MHDVNWWLMALAFVLGLVLTLVLMIGRVTREVPVTHAVSAGVGASGLKGPHVKVPDVDVPDVDVPDVKLPGVPAAGAAAVGAVAAGAAAAKFAAGDVEEPYGKGSARVAAGAAAPSGWTIKGNEDSMLYHTVDSPWYEQTIAELWFFDEPTAQAAGFTRWDAKDSGAATIASLADVPAGPYGKGSAKAGDGGSGPVGWLIKGNEDSMLYHTVDSPWYEQTIAELWFFDEPTAQAAGFTRWDAKDSGAATIASLADVPAGPYGKGSARAGDGGSGPVGWLIKGNEDSMLYHTVDSPSYKQTIAEVWFFDEETAKAAGFDRWDKNSH